MSGFDPKAYLAKAAPAAAPAPSGFDPKAYLAKAAPVEEEEPGLLARAGRGLLENVIVPVGRAVDRFTGAPTRAAAEEVIQGKGLLAAGGRFAEQFGAAPESAPTGKELAQQLGASEKTVSDALPGLYSESGDEWLKFKRGGLLDPTASGAAGLGLDIALDPTNVIPAGAAAKALKGVAKPAAKVAGTAARVGAAATDLATGTKAASKVLEGTTQIAKRAADTISSIATPKRAKNYERLAETARKVGLNPEEISAAAEFGKGSIASRLERNIAEGPAGGKLLENFEKVSEKIAEGTDGAIRKMGSGQVHDPIGAGELLKQGYANAEKAVLDNANITYRSASDLTPGMRLTPAASKKLGAALSGLEKRATGMVQRGGTNAQVSMGRDLLGSVQRMRKNGDNYRQLADQIGFIGEAMSDPALNHVHAKELRKVYRELSDALISTVSDIHPDLGKQLKANNKSMSDFFKARDNLGNAIQSAKSNPEAVYKAMIGDVTRIDELKKVLPKPEFDAFRASFMDSLVKRNNEGQILYDSSIKAIKANKGRLSKMFSPEELDELGSLLELGAAQGTPVLSTSGTGASNAFREIKEGLSGGLLNEQVLNRMKQRGRGLLPDSEQVVGPAAQAAPGAAPAASSAARPAMSEAVIEGRGILDSVPNLRRGKLERRLKGAQSVAPGEYEERYR